MNLNLENGYLIVIIAIVIVVLINVGLMAGIRPKNKPTSLNLFQKNGNSLYDPWHEENSNLKELSERVKSLKNQQD